MKLTKITPPEGWELDLEKSTFDEIVFKEIEKDIYPDSVEEIKGRDWYLASGSIDIIQKNPVGIVSHTADLSTKGRAEAFLALMQLVELRDEYNRIDGVTIDWGNPEQKKYTITSRHNEILMNTFCIYYKVLFFGIEETRDLFYDKHRDLLEIAKELI